MDIFSVPFAPCPCIRIWRQPDRNLSRSLCYDISPLSVGYDVVTTLTNITNFVSGVVANLNSINKTQTGKILLESIKATQKSMAIVPYEKSDQNAYAKALNDRDALPKGRPRYSCKDGSFLGDNNGTGVGSNVEVHFSPGMWISSATQTCSNILPRHPIPEDPCGASALSDEILFHEMVHGLREMMGVLWCTPLNGYDTFEEFVAIVAANVYISEKDNKELLRADHHGYAQLKNSAKFSKSKENISLMRRIHNEQPEMVKQLAIRVNAPFNPFRDLYRAHYTRKGKAAGSKPHVGRHR